MPIDVGLPLLPPIYRWARRPPPRAERVVFPVLWCQGRDRFGALGSKFVASLGTLRRRWQNRLMHDATRHARSVPSAAGLTLGRWGAGVGWGLLLWAGCLGCGDAFVVELGGGASLSRGAPGPTTSLPSEEAAPGMSSNAAGPAGHVGGAPALMGPGGFGPCIRWRPVELVATPGAPLSLAPVATGQCAVAAMHIENCGTTPLSQLAWRHGDVATPAGAVTGGADGVVDGLEPSWVLAPGAAQQVKLRVCPLVAAPYAMAFEVVARTVGVMSASPSAIAEVSATVEVSGTASVGCLVPRLDLPAATMAGATLQASAADSLSPSGAAVTARWRLLPPDPWLTAPPIADGLVAAFAPVIAGSWGVCVALHDAAGVKGCAEVCSEVAVLPAEALRVELLWQTPADADANDSGPGAGADLDLHLAMLPSDGVDRDCDGQPDPWFSASWDTWWGAVAQPWGAPTTADDGTLVLDDSDGQGPEVASVQAPAGTSAKPQTYTIGVHAWHDHGHGESLARVRVWIGGALVGVFGPQPLQALDLWTVARVRWPNALVEGGAKTAEIQPLLQCAQLGDPCAGGKRWMSAGSACLTHCYTPLGGQASNHAAPAACAKGG